MSRYSLAVFDVDGTLLDTTNGVLSSVKYTIEQFGFEMLPQDKLLDFIGPPIQDSFANAYGLSGDILQEIATVFRNRYKTADLLNAVPYSGIFDLFDQLSRSGVRPAVATYKREDYAITLLRHFGFDRYTSIMFGGDHENKLKKCDIIKKCIDAAGIDDISKVIMIGDTLNDAVGAKNLGIDFAAVTYGFGFKTRQELDSINKKCIAHSVGDLSVFFKEN